MIQSAATPAVALMGTEGLYVTGDDHLLLTVSNSLAGVAVALSGRQLHKSGDVVPFSEPHTPASDRSATTRVARLARGWLQHLTVTVTTGAPIGGQTFARVDLVRGEGAGRIVLATLAAGYVTARNGLAWPGSALRSSIEGAGALRSITGADPAAGAEVSETVPTGARWALRALRVTLVTDATVANREVALTFDDGVTVYAEYPSSVNQTATQSRAYTASPAGVRGGAATSLAIMIATAPIVALSGHRIRTLTTGLAGGDNFGAPQLDVEEWIEGA